MTEDEVRNRIRSAIIMLKSGHCLSVGDLVLCSLNKNNFSVTGWTNYADSKYITKDLAREELNDIKNIFNKMLSVSEELSAFVKNKEIKYSLSLNYGMGCIGICEEENGQIRWLIKLED